MFISFMIMYLDVGLSNLRSSNNVKRESDNLPKIRRVLIERLINLILENVGLRSDMREWYFAFFRSLLSCILDSNPTVNSRIYREEPVTSTRSGLRESPVIMLGDRYEGRSAYSEHLGNDEKVFARWRRTEL